MSTMSKLIAAYAATAAVMVTLDLLWLGVIAKSFYQQGIGHLMAERPNMPVAILFYSVFALGLMFFAVAPPGALLGAGGGATNDWSRTLIVAALFGFFAYATYDLTNLATLKDWPLGVSLADMAWGTVVATIAAAAGKFAFDRMAAV